MKNIKGMLNDIMNIISEYCEPNCVLEAELSSYLKYVFNKYLLKENSKE